MSKPKPIVIEGIRNGRNVDTGRKTGDDTARARRYVLNFINKTDRPFHTAEVVKATKLNRYRVTRALMWLEDIDVLERTDGVKLRPGPGRPTIVWDRKARRNGRPEIRWDDAEA